jgi:hypothetical protein
MNRRWQKDAGGQYHSLKSLNWLASTLPPLSPELSSLASVADVYSTYSALHAKRRNPVPAVDRKRGIWLLLADSPAQQPLQQQEPAGLLVGSCTWVSLGNIGCQAIEAFFDVCRGGQGQKLLLLSAVLSHS